MVIKMCDSRPGFRQMIREGHNHCRVNLRGDTAIWGLVRRKRLKIGSPETLCSTSEETIDEYLLLGVLFCALDILAWNTSC